MPEPRDRDAGSPETAPPETDALPPAAPGAGPADARPALSAGQVLGGRYRIRALLGRGGMGEVWHAFDQKLRVEVALKSLHPTFYADEGRRELLRTEVRTAREVLSPNVCRVYDLVEADGHELLSMEHVDGETLLSLLRRRAPLPLAEAGEIAAQFLAGLQAVHEAGLVHRDFKPENVMITRAGRVLVMDFGIAKKTEAASGTYAGTPAYMSPEQLRGELVDRRSDLYSAGIVLAEMVAPGGVQERATREALWKGVRLSPPRVPDTAWAEVIQRAVAPEPGQRPASAQALIRAIEEATLRVEGTEDKRPYPGLASFTEADAEHFYGREAEVEVMGRRLHRPHLQALIGPSGAGKTSFLRAGLIPAMPSGWAHAYCQPGKRPFVALAQALAPDLSGDTEAVRLLAAFEELDGAVTAVSRWRRRHTECVLIVDQFEELFTLNPPDVQGGFAELLARLALEANVHVLLCMRDDFLLHCHAHAPLAPLFSELTPIGPPTGAALQRALVQPALACGYRFEDEALASDMLAAISSERGALPLLAFAAAGLWERRDRQKGLLTREAYETIGGVGGALARHAEATLGRIGLHREPVVRELFRNLVTAQGTRAIRDREELLSVFEDKRAAEEVLGQLIAARLLTSFEATEPARGASGQPERTVQWVEVIHESLLSAWPRLVRWRSQDSEGAQLREQLRQAASLWADRGRPEELLWTGASFLEYRAWRERYPGGLTDTETAFGRAMEALAGRRRRTRRALAGAAFAVLLAAAATFGALWRSAADEARRATASELLALGRLELKNDPTAALAYALRSLELHDDPVVRRFGLEVLWGGPTRIAIGPVLAAPLFTPDGRWLGNWGLGDGTDLEVYGSDGRIHNRAAAGGMAFGAVSPDSKWVVVMLAPFTKLRFYSVPDLELREKQFEAPTAAFYADGSLEGEGHELFTATRLGPTEGGERVLLRSWAVNGEGEPKARGTLVVGGRFPEWALHPDAERGRVAHARGREVFLSSLDLERSQPPLRVGEHDHPVTSVRLSPDGRWLASGDATGEVRLFSTEEIGPALRRVTGPSPSAQLHFSPDGTWLALAGADTTIGLLDLTSPSSTVPLILRSGEKVATTPTGFGPGGWLASAGSSASIWPLAHRYPSVLRGHRGAVQAAAFAPDGSWLASGGFRDGTVRVWPLRPDAPPARVVFEGGANDPVWDVDVSPDGRRLLVGQQSGRVHVVPVGGGPPRLLEGRRGQAMTVAFGPQGRFVAAAGGQWIAKERVIHVWDLESGRLRVLDAGDGHFIRHIRFLRDGRLLSATDAGGGLRLWDVEAARSTLLREGVCKFAVSPDERSVYAACQEAGRHWVDQGTQGRETVPLVQIDLASGKAEALEQHLQRDDLAVPITLDPTGRHLVTGGFGGVVSVRPSSGGPGHLLLGHEGMVWRVAVSPDGRRIASASQDGTVRVWPMPEGAPFHTLPRAELLERIRLLTNLRIADDPDSSTGYAVRVDPFPGWESRPIW